VESADQRNQGEVYAPALCNRSLPAMLQYGCNSPRRLKSAGWLDLRNQAQPHILREILGMPPSLRVARNEDCSFSAAHREPPPQESNVLRRRPPADTATLAVWNRSRPHICPPDREKSRKAAWEIYMCRGRRDACIRKWISAARGRTSLSQTSRLCRENLRGRYHHANDRSFGRMQYPNCNCVNRVWPE